MMTNDETTLAAMLADVYIALDRAEAHEVHPLLVRQHALLAAVRATNRFDAVLRKAMAARDARLRAEYDARLLRLGA